ncbi:MAG TPA: bacillithiol biosynthesis cysteine-adding enzyme BshC, partial [Bacteroidia bacterium]|nr:bacillithiol biosynthesis cysteine-adding enzyme BshC [Bacteroidia bacterium]
AEQLSFDDEKRQTLCRVIRQQYTSSGIDVPADLISALEKKTSVTITTGHQLCLFTGPLYFIYKILAAVRIAQEQSRKLGREVVPVYWMASEDHDFDEIASVNVFGKTITWTKPAEGAVGHLRTDLLGEVMAQVKAVCGESENAKELLSVFETAYAPGRSLADATRILVHRLFEGKILVLDPDDVSLKKYFVPHFHKDIFENTFAENVQASLEKLKTAGFDAPVNPRAINVFYLGSDFRRRLEKTGGKYMVDGTAVSFTPGELEQELASHPERFSPNVVLRPLYQQVILPNISYVGGPAEISYWLEYRSMFEAAHVHFPVLQPRFHALVIDKNSASRMEKLGITAEQLFAGADVLVKRFIADNAGVSVSLEKEKEKLAVLYAEIAAAVAKTDVTLKQSAEAELQKALKGLETLEGKMMRAAKQKEETNLAQLHKLHEKLFPAGGLQERYDNFIPFFLGQGYAFFRKMEEAVEFPVSGICIVFPD